jgi:hypothetical protein
MSALSYRAIVAIYLFFSHKIEGKPILCLPIRRSNNASRIFLFNELGFVPAIIDSRVIDPCGGTSAGDISHNYDFYI